MLHTVAANELLFSCLTSGFHLNLSAKISTDVMFRLQSDGGRRRRLLASIKANLLLFDSVMIENGCEPRCCSSVLIPRSSGERRLHGRTFQSKCPQKGSGRSDLILF